MIPRHVQVSEAKAGFVRIRQVRGLQQVDYRRCLIVTSTLGLRRIGHEVVRQNTPATWGAIRLVQDLVLVVEVT